MNPAPPVTSSLMPDRLARARARPGSRRARRARRAARSRRVARCAAPSTAGAAPGGASISVVADITLRLDLRLVEDLLGELEPGALAAAAMWWMPKALALDQPRERRRPGAGVGRASRPGRRRRAPRRWSSASRSIVSTKLLAADAEEPRGADDEVRAGWRPRPTSRPPASCGRRRRAAPAGRTRRRARPWRRRRRSRWRRRRPRADARPRPRRAAPAPVSLTAIAPALVGLGAVDVGPGGAVDHRVGAVAVDRRLDRVGVGDVELGARSSADDLVAGVVAARRRRRGRASRPRR